MALKDVPKKKVRNLDPKFSVPLKSKKRVPKIIKGKDAIKAFEKEISPRGMAKTKAEQTAALDKLMNKRYGKKK